MLANMNIQVFRQQLGSFLHHPTGRWGHMFTGFVVVLILLSMAELPLRFTPLFTGPAATLLHGFDMFIFVFFTIEYIARLLTAPSWWRFALSWYGIIDLLAIVPFLLSVMGVVAEHPEFLALRALRILKLAKAVHLQREADYEESIKHSRHQDFAPMDGEKIERIVGQHPIIFVATLLPPTVFLNLAMGSLLVFGGSPWGLSLSILFGTFAFVFFYKSWLDFHYDVIFLTNRRVVVQNRYLFGRSTNAISYDAITNASPDDRGFWRFLFGFGDIKIETAAVEGHQHFSGAAKVHDVIKHISNNRQHFHRRGSEGGQVFLGQQKDDVADGDELLARVRTDSKRFREKFF